jgi:Flp pilus assembly protein TadB
MTAIGLVLGATFMAGIVLAAAAWNGWQAPAIFPMALARGDRVRGRIWTTVAVAAGVATLTRWPVAAISAAALTWLWPELFGGARESRHQLARLEAVATWTESLRDTMAAAIGLEQAIISSVDVAPDPIAPQLHQLAGRLRAHIPLPVALAAFAEEFDDASVDLVTAALIMNARLRGSGLVGTLTALADTARDELTMRTRIEEGRKNLRRSARVIMAVTVVFAGGMMVLSRDYLRPYGTVAGQAMLLVVMGGFLAGFLWIRNASRVDPPPRFLAAPADLIAREGAPT